MNEMINTLNSIKAQNNTVFNGRTEDKGLVFQFTFDSVQKFQLAKKEVENTPGYRGFLGAWSINAGIITAKFVFKRI